MARRQNTKMAGEQSKLCDPQYISEDGILALANISTSDDDALQISSVDTLPINVHRLVCKAINYFLDYVIFAALETAGNLDVRSIRSALASLVPSSLNDVGYSQAQNDLEQYSGEYPIPGSIYSNPYEISDSNIAQVFRLLRSKCMAFSSLGKNSDHEYKRMKADADPDLLDGMTPFLTVYLTTVLESVGDYLIIRAARTARKRVGKKRATTHSSKNILLKLGDLEYAAESSPLSILWESWMANYWRKHFVTTNQSVQYDQDDGSRSRSRRKGPTGHGHRSQRTRNHAISYYPQNDIAIENQTSHSEYQDLESNILSMRLGLEGLLERVLGYLRDIDEAVKGNKHRQIQEIQQIDMPSPIKEHRHRLTMPAKTGIEESPMSTSTVKIEKVTMDPHEKLLLKESTVESRTLKPPTELHRTRGKSEDFPLERRVKKMKRSRSSTDLEVLRHRRPTSRRSNTALESQVNRFNIANHEHDTQSIRSQYTMDRQPSQRSVQSAYVVPSGNRQPSEHNIHRVRTSDTEPQRQTEEITETQHFRRESVNNPETRAPSYRVTEEERTFRRVSEQQPNNDLATGALGLPSLPSQQQNFGALSKQERKKQKKRLKNEQKEHKKRVKAAQKEQEKQVKERQKNQERQLKAEQRDRQRQIAKQQKEQKRQVAKEQKEQQRQVKTRQKEQKREEKKRQKEQRRALERREKEQMKEVKQRQKAQQRAIKERQKAESRAQQGGSNGRLGGIFARS